MPRNRLRNPLKVEDLPVGLRRPLAEDMSFVTHSWRFSYRDHSDASQRMSLPGRSVFIKRHLPFIMDLATYERLMIAYSKVDDELIYGWICAEPELEHDGHRIIHYLHVKEDFKRWGIGSLLLKSVGMEPETTVMATHMTWQARALARACRLKIEYNPYVLEELGRG